MTRFPVRNPIISPVRSELERASLSTDLPHLHGILKDETRARILELLEQREPLGYVELQTLLGISHTGKLNYHLKVLADLVSKDEKSGEYRLSEKGRLAVALLDKFQTITRSDSAALKAKLKLGLALGVAGAMAALSLFFILVGIPGSSESIALQCSAGSSCIANSNYSTTYTPTPFALVPLALAFVAGLGFYERRRAVTSLASVALLPFSVLTLFSIGILYVPFGVALTSLSLCEGREPHESRPGVSARLAGLGGGVAVAAGGSMISIALARSAGPFLLSIGMPPVLLLLSVFLAPLALSTGLGYALMSERPEAGRLMILGGVVTSFFLPILVSGGL